MDEFERLILGGADIDSVEGVAEPQQPAVDPHSSVDRLMHKTLNPERPAPRPRQVERRAPRDLRPDMLDFAGQNGDREVDQTDLNADLPDFSAHGAPVTVPNPEPRPADAPKPGDTMPPVQGLDEVQFRTGGTLLDGDRRDSLVDGTTTGMLSGDEAYKQGQQRIAAAEAAYAEAKKAREENELFQKERLAQGKELRPYMRDAYRVMKEKEDAALAALTAVRQNPMPTQTATRDKLERVVQTVGSAGTDAANFWRGLIESSLIPQKHASPEKQAKQRLQQETVSKQAKGVTDAIEDAVNRAASPDPTQTEDFSSKLTEGATSMAVFLAAGATARGLGAPSALATGGVGGAQQAGQLFREVEHKTEELQSKLAALKAKGEDTTALDAELERLAKVKFYALAGGFGLGMTEALPIERFLDRVSSVSRNTRIKTMVLDGTIQSLEEMMQEIGQQVGSNVIAQLYEENRDIFKGVADSAKVAAVLGFMMGGVGGLVRPLERENRVSGVPQPQIPSPEETLQNIETALARTQPQGEAQPEQPAAPQPQQPSTATAEPQQNQPAPDATSITPQEDTEIADENQQASKPKSAITPADRSVLTQLGFTDENIADMNAAEVKAHLEDAKEQGIEPAADADGDGVPDFAEGGREIKGDGTRTAPSKVEDAVDLELAAEAVNTDPSDAQKEAGNYKKGHVQFDGFNISLENPAGSIRKGKTRSAGPWESPALPAHYGYVKRSKGADGDQLDVYLAKEPKPGSKIYVVDQKSPGGLFDEHKAMLGFENVDDARKAYEGSFDKFGADRIMAITELTQDEFKDWLKTGKHSHPISRQKIGKALAGANATAEVAKAPLEGEIIEPIKGDFEQKPWTAADGNPWGMSDEDYAEWRKQPENREAVEKWERDNKIIDADTTGQPEALDFSADGEAVGDERPSGGHFAVKKDGKEFEASVRADGGYVASVGGFKDKKKAEAARLRIKELWLDAESLTSFEEAIREEYDNMELSFDGGSAVENENVAEVEAVLAEAGVPVDQVNEADIERAAEIMEDEGTPAAEAFEEAVIENALDNEIITQTDLEEVFGDDNEVQRGPVLEDGGEDQQQADAYERGSGQAQDEDGERVSRAGEDQEAEAEQVAEIGEGQDGVVGDTESGGRGAESVVFNPKDDAAVQRAIASFTQRQSGAEEFLRENIKADTKAEAILDLVAKSRAWGPAMGSSGNDEPGILGMENRGKVLKIWFRDGVNDSGTRIEIGGKKLAEHLRAIYGPKAEEAQQEAEKPKKEKKKAKAAFVETALDKKEKVEDVGEKIGGARKDTWKERGLQWSDVSGLTGTEQDALVTKENVWPKPDYAQMVEEGAEPLAAYLVKLVYDRIGSKPSASYDISREQFIERVNKVREIALQVKTSQDVREKLNKALGWNDAYSIGRKQGHRQINPLSYDSVDVRRAEREIKLGWPNREPWTRKYYVQESDRWNEETKKHEKIGWTVRERKTYVLVGGRDAVYQTKELAEAAAKAAYENASAEEKDKLPKRPHLEKVTRSGPDYRKGKDISAEDFKDTFGFRGVEFGNYAANDERQKMVNLAFDALHDLARILNLPPKAISLNGTMGLAFAARGKGGFAAAHYEAGKFVINLTKLSGAGTLAHEWAHAFDHYMGELDQYRQYDGPPKSISGWNTKESSYGAHRYSNLTPRLAQNAAALMNRIFKREETAEEQEKRYGDLVRRAKTGKENWGKYAEDAKASITKQPSRARYWRGQMDKARQNTEYWERQIKRYEDKENWHRLSVDSDFYTGAVAISGASGYWARPTELFARSFEAYVFDKLAANGEVSQYLVQGVEQNRFGTEYKGNPYPSGIDRTEINKAYDKLFRAIDAADGKLGPKTKIVGSKEPEPKEVVEEATPVPQITAKEKGAQLEAEMEAVADATEEFSDGKAASLADVFADRLRSGGSFQNIVSARQMAAKGGFKEDVKQIEEALELAVVKVAREIVSASKDQVEAYKALVDLYGRQPKLGTRTSTSMRDQAYSTPAPLAYLASRLADIGPGTLVYEPSAGNGALLIEADPMRARVNEINPQRAANLGSLGFQFVRQDDASQPIKAKGGVGSVEAGEADRVIANPPFGAVQTDGESKVFDLSDIQEGYKTKEIDHAIALRSLAAMKADGRAVLILGGITKMATTEQARSDAYAGKAKREFYKTLYDRYNVVDHFTVAGELYERQGAGWPVDVVVIEGRGKSERKLPAADVPRVYSSWAQLGELIDGTRTRSDGRKAVVDSGEAADGQGLDDASRADDGERGSDLAGAGIGERGDVQPGASAGERSGATAVEERDGNEDAAGVGGRGGNDPRADAERRASGLENFDDLFDSALDAEFGAEKSLEQRAEDRGAEAFAEGIISASATDKKFIDEILPEATKEGSTLKVLDAWNRGWHRANLAAPVEEAKPRDDREETEALIAQARELKDPALDKILDDMEGALDEAKGNDWARLRTGLRRAIRKAEESKDTRTTKEVTKSAAENLTGSAEDAMKGLVQLFGGGKQVSSGLGFDPETYAKAKPLFVKAATKFSAFQNDVAELIKRMVGELRSVYGLTREGLEAMRPYLKRFVEEVQSGVIRLGEQVKQKLAPKQKQEETSHQVEYQPKSGETQSLGTLVPVNMQTSVAEALNALEAEVGNIDQYVANQLDYTTDELADYFAAEQVDALALAIFNMEKGKGFIIGDQTGIGKGRVNAGIIRWAIMRGRVPVFVTEKPNLYADMYRDLSDIDIQKMLGREIKMLPTNNSLNVPLDDDNTKFLRSGDAAKHKIVLETFASAKDGEKPYDVVFTNYSQMQTLKGKETERRQFLRAVAPNAILIFDESHNAGGQAKNQGEDGVEDRAKLARTLVTKSKGVFYSSATYAKRPDVMDLYAATDMVMAVAKPEDLGEAIAKGGVPMQQVVAAMLAKAGQYIRRERSFAGIKYETPVIEVDRSRYDQISESLADIDRFSRKVALVASKITEELKKEAGAVSGDNATGSVGAQSTLFTSIMHNIINQMLLAMKAKGAAKMAIETLKAGEKPVITVANTMESFLTQYAEDAGILHDQPISANFGDILIRYLDRTRTLIIKKPFMKKGEKAERHYLTDEELGSDGLAAYEQAKQFIQSIDFSGLAVSPIDAIKNEIEKAGYRIGEVTGRGTIVDYSGDEPILRSRPGKEVTIRGRRETIVKYNSGEIDAVILNQAGSTGISLHASERFKDQKPRHMIVAQAEGNIDTHMQMLGRINRTGQVNKPRYSQLVADIPAERRPAAVLAKKMASLNANTTASRGSALTAKDVPDFINQYGDQVAVTIMADDADLHRRLGSPIKQKENGAMEPNDAMRRVTGRIPLLRLKEQEELYEHLEAEYAALLTQMDASGQNALEAKTLDLKAETIATAEVVKKKGGSDSPFAAPVNIEKVRVVRLGKPMSPVELAQRIVKETYYKLEEEVTEKNAAQIIQRAAQGYDTGYRHTLHTAANDFDTYRREILDDIEKEERKTKEREKLDAIKTRWQNVASRLSPGARITLKTSDGNFTGIVLKTEHKKGAKNPLAMSSWKTTFAIGDATRTVTLPLSRLFESGKSPEDDAYGIEIQPINYERYEQTLERFSALQNDTHEDRFIATGNILAAYDWLQTRGQIINYTDNEGNVRQGIMAPKQFDFDEYAASRASRITSPQGVIQWLEKNRGQLLQSVDKNISLSLSHGDRLDIHIVAAKAKGGRFYLDKQITNITGDFYKRGPFMEGDTRETKPVIARLMELGAEFAAVNENRPKLTPVAPPSGAMEQRLADGADSDEFSAPSDSELMFRFNTQWIKNKANREKLEASLQRIFDRMLGEGRVEVSFPSYIYSHQKNTGWPDDPNRQEDRGHFARGRYRFGAHHVIEIATGLKNGEEIISTAFHEAFHAAEDLMLTPREIEVMKREEPRLRNYIRPIMQRHGYSEAELQALGEYEVRAIAFQRYVEARHGFLSGADQSEGLHIAVRRFFERLMELARSTLNVLRGLGFQTSETIFDQLSSGNMAQRQTMSPTNYAPIAEAFREQALNRRPAPVASYKMLPETWREAFERTDLPFRERMWRALEAASLPLNRALGDKLADLHRTVVSARLAVGQIGENLDAYLQATIFSGRVQKRIEDFHERMLNAVSNMTDDGITIAEMSEYLYARHAPEANAEIARINPEMPDGGSGMTNDEADQIMQRFQTDGKIPALEQHAAAFDGFLGDIRQMYVSYGLESQETVDEWAQQYGFYVPLRGFAADQNYDEAKGTGRGYDIRYSETRERLGRRSKADNIVVNIWQMAERAIIRGEKNKVGNAFLRFAQRYPHPDLYKINRAERKRRKNPETGLVEWYTSVPSHMSENVFATKIGGQTYYIEIKHEGLLAALKSIGAANLPAGLRWLSWITRQLAMFRTARNPEFFIGNVIRDIQDAALLNLKGEERSGLVKEFLKNVATLRPYIGAAIYKSGLAPNSNNRFARLADQWEKDGGQVAHYGLRDLSQIRAELEREFKIAQESRLETYAKAPLRTPRAILKAIEFVNDVLETGTRIAAYDAAVKVGLTRRQAARISKEATVDFNKGGAYTSIANSFYIFFNARVRGGIQLIRRMRESKKVRRAMLGMIALGYTITEYNLAVSPVDDDDEKKRNAYEKLKYWERERNFIIYLPGNPRPYKMPIGFGLQIFYMLGENAAMVRNGKISPLEAAVNMLGTTFNAFSPISMEGSFADPKTIMRFITPSLAMPFLDMSLNRDWKGGKIHPDEAQWNKGVPDSERHFSTTSPYAIQTAQFINRLTGGNSLTPGYIDVHPDTLDYMANFSLGGLGAFAKRGYRFINDAADGIPTPTEHIPILRIFRGTDKDTTDRAEFYEESNKAREEGNRLRQARKNEEKGYKTGDAEAVLERGGQIKAAEKVMNNARKQLKRLSDEINTVRSDPSLSRAEKQTRITEIQKEMTAVRRAAVKEKTEADADR